MKKFGKGKEDSLFTFYIILAQTIFYHLSSFNICLNIYNYLIAFYFLK